MRNQFLLLFISLFALGATAVIFSDSTSPGPDCSTWADPTAARFITWDGLIQIEAYESTPASNITSTLTIAYSPQDVNGPELSITNTTSLFNITNLRVSFTIDCPTAQTCNFPNNDPSNLNVTGAYLIATVTPGAQAQFLSIIEYAIYFPANDRRSTYRYEQVVDPRPSVNDFPDCPDLDVFTNPANYIYASTTQEQRLEGSAQAICPPACSTSPSVSLTPSVSLSSTPSISLTSTPSTSLSSTPSTSLSSTPSTSLSNTPSTSLTSTPSTSLSSTSSISLSSTPSISLSNTPSSSPSTAASLSSTSTPSLSSTPSTSLSNTPSISLSSTPSTSLSNTPSSSPSTAASLSSTPSTSITSTPSISLSNTPSSSPSTVASLSSTPSASLSNSPSSPASLSNSPTSSISSPPTPSNTPSPLGVLPSETASPSSVPSPSSSPPVYVCTPSPAPTCVPTEVCCCNDRRAEQAELMADLEDLQNTALRVDKRINTAEEVQAAIEDLAVINSHIRKIQAVLDIINN